MKTIGLKLREIRKRKGHSQEELSFKTNVSLRTIQRIEKGENEPRGKTLQLLCNALDVKIEELVDFGKQEDKGVLSALYLSVLTGVILPLGNIIVPALFWVLNKEKYKEVNNVGKHILISQVVYAVISTLLIVSWTLTKILQLSYSQVLLVLFVSFSIYNYAMAIYGSIKIKNSGKRYFFWCYRS